MQCGQDDQRQPDPEVVNLKDLAPREGQDEHAEELRDRDAAEDASAHVGQRGPGSQISAPEFRL